ncbi:hypothetical protein RHMOL_Rhmol06G0253400 [Rhododendron molle]|uniref:Uncharacterized protein n=1 Tax=Rhododendron molle TaxID=49168 RepID=A0ACC0NHJ1_RHOML|nr:hypothetical protein RHMOL_Rhmol06G0253400 [Rhododendron molle]
MVLMAASNDTPPRCQGIHLNCELNFNSSLPTNKITHMFILFHTTKHQNLLVVWHAVFCSLGSDYIMNHHSHTKHPLG